MEHDVKATHRAHRTGRRWSGSLLATGLAVAAMTAGFVLGPSGGGAGGVRPTPASTMSASDPGAVPVALDGPATATGDARP
jgi:hypothetical protein